jgi:hypothetical protein
VVTVTCTPYCNGPCSPCCEAPPASVEACTRPWRVGRQVVRTLYDAADQLIGVMDTPDLAATVVAAVNKETEHG